MTLAGIRAYSIRSAKEKNRAGPRPSETLVMFDRTTGSCCALSTAYMSVIQDATAVSACEETNVRVLTQEFARPRGIRFLKWVK